MTTTPPPDLRADPHAVSRAEVPVDSPVDSGTGLLVIVLAAGAGTRMKSSIPKVLHKILGRPIIGHVLDSIESLCPASCAVVVGHGREQVEQYLATDFAWARPVVQRRQLGTGDAARVGMAAGAADPQDQILIVAGDSALLTAATLARLVKVHAERGAGVTLLTATVPDPTGYGRVIRDESGGVARIVEHRDADAQQRGITEINTSTYVFRRDALATALSRLSADNAQGELLLTDAIALIRDAGLPVAALRVDDPDEVHGINDRIQLAQAARIMADRINDDHMRNGVTILDPATTWIERGVAIDADATVERNTYLGAGTRIARGATVGPDTTLLACIVGADALVRRVHAERARIGDRCDVGPFTFLRPGAELAADSKAGAYVEIKNSTVGPGSKVPHLTYVGDATIGAGSNIGAATVFVNYDGVAKHHSTVGDQVRIGSDTMIVAPVHIGDGAYTAAGSVITEDVPAGAMAIGRGRQVNLAGWVARKRPGSPAARAAEAAQD